MLADALAPDMVPAVTPGQAPGVEIHPMRLFSAGHQVTPRPDSPHSQFE